MHAFFMVLVVLFLAIISAQSDVAQQTSANPALPPATILPTPPPAEIVVSNVPAVIFSSEVDAVASSTSSRYAVVSIVDGDTVDVMLESGVERLRLIGIDTPETVDPRKPVECFGLEASRRAKEILTDEKVRLEHDPSQGERDKYGRLLRYVFLSDGTNVNLQMVAEGYAHEYTHSLPYQYQAEFRAAETSARAAGAGLWGAVCDQYPASTGIAPVVSNPPNPQCTIKGNINAGAEKIYHTLGCDSYSNTRIDEARGERWFCSETEALGAGWRKAKNCL